MISLRCECDKCEAVYLASIPLNEVGRIIPGKRALPDGWMAIRLNAICYDLCIPCAVEWRALTEVFDNKRNAFFTSKRTREAASKQDMREGCTMCGKPSNGPRRCLGNDSETCDCCNSCANNCAITA